MAAGNFQSVRARGLRRGAEVRETSAANQNLISQYHNISHTHVFHVATKTGHILCLEYNRLHTASSGLTTIPIFTVIKATAFGIRHPCIYV